MKKLIDILIVVLMWFSLFAYAMSKVHDRPHGLPEASANPCRASK